MEDTRETEIAKRWLFFDPAAPTYWHWQEVTGEIIALTRGVTAPSSWARREAAALLLADRLQTDIARDSDVLVSDVGIYGELVHTALDNVDWCHLAEALIDEHALRVPGTAAPQKTHGTPLHRARCHTRSYAPTA